jgi:hypothetical protein
MRFAVCTPSPAWSGKHREGAEMEARVDQAADPDHDELGVLVQHVQPALATSSGSSSVLSLSTQIASTFSLLSKRSSAERISYGPGSLPTSTGTRSTCSTRAMLGLIRERSSRKRAMHDADPLDASVDEGAQADEGADARDLVGNAGRVAEQRPLFVEERRP